MTDEPSTATPGSRAAPDPVLRCDHLIRRFGDRVAVNDVSFEIAPGETYGLLGPNGAGKTTTIRMVCGLLRRDAGSVAVLGQSVGPRSTAAKVNIGYVPQDVALYPDLSAEENLRFFGRLYGLSGTQLANRVVEVLELLELADRAKDRVESFSGGMQRRLNIGAGLLHEPALLVLDEPTAGVDPQSRHAILERVQSFGRTGMAVLYTTHYMEEAERLCDRVGVMDRGSLIAEGSRRELISLVGERDRIELTVAGAVDAFADACRTVAGIQQATAAGDEVHLLAENGRRLLPAVLEAAETTGTSIDSVEVVEPDLEAVFLHLTGTALRD